MGQIKSSVIAERGANWIGVGVGTLRSESCIVVDLWVDDARNYARLTPSEARDMIRELNAAIDICESRDKDK